MSEWVILGANGMLGQDVTNLLSDSDYLALDKSKCDVTSFDNLRDLITEARYVINCAAYTAVDAAESNEEIAHEINAVGAGNVAKLCAELNAKLVHISTDYVFTGDASAPYAENSATEPKSAYGRTKLAGEQAVQKFLPADHYIVRTAWLYGQHGPNFVKTMINLEKDRETIAVVNDQIGQPTWTKDLAVKILELINAKGIPGIYHGTSSGQSSWFGFARKIFELLGADIDRVRPTTSDEFVRPAPRPKYSVLGHENWKQAGIEPIRNWETAISEAYESGCFN